jgi:hypothetical protein
MGHVLVAQSSILPGAELFTDKAIVEFCGPFSCLKPVDTVVFFASFMESNGSDQLEKLMALPVKYPCPSVCAIRCELESAAHNLGLGGLRKYTPRDIEQLLRFVCVLRQKSVDLPCGRSLVYGTAGMLYSSCDPNCHLTISEDGWCICRASSFISAGDVLTVAFTECLCVAGTPNRRNFLLYGKDFTCHCVRCDAVSDDARQFNCYKGSQCHGRHYACEPRWPTQTAHIQYDGVEYVEPYLLPCTICHCSAPAWYQAAMFAQEEHVMDNLWRTDAMLQTGSTDISVLQDLYLPPSHFLGSCTAGLEMAWRMDQLTAGLGSAATHRTKLAQLANDMESAFEITTRAMLRHRYDTQVLAIRAFYRLSMYQRALGLARRLLRLHRIREGRDNTGTDIGEDIEEEVRLAVVRAHGCAGAASGCCVFCEESPERAAMTLSRCGACKQAIYCGRACQKAHWKLHKAACKH